MKTMTAARNTDCSSRPLFSRVNTHTHDDGLTPAVYSSSDSPILSGPNSNEPAWKRLVNRASPPHEVISLIETILASENEMKMIGNLCGDNAQSAIDVIHEVPSLLLCFRGRI